MAKKPKKEEHHEEPEKVEEPKKEESKSVLTRWRERRAEVRSKRGQK